ncbi:sensor domain-containing diguanylate cyclase [Inhella crocodyli]|uniref:Sensor domain-containing diguanylate cyclase n=1 Tax=Inhella crocodyli TaxID=2499851 RepID=A0A437LAP8_9BURK|nr:sensor domain-containing diguanylate cyclase [Inhella crocodyli]RVT82475.1 sensor domain-containing diguanylate cyclase [Inhella crocodyli]
MPSTALTPDRRRPSLVRRLTWTSLGVMALALLLSAALLAWVTYRHLQGEQVRSAEQGASLLIENLAPTLAFKDPVAADRVLRGLRQRGDLLELQVWTAANTGFADWRAAGRGMTAWTRGGEGTHLDHEGMTLVRPIRLQGELLGWLVWRESFSSLNASLARLALWALGVALAACAAAGLALAWVQRQALTPLVDLSRLAEQVADGQDYGLRAQVGRQDEVGRLATRLNGMLARIEAADRELKQQLRQEQRAGQALHQLAHRDPLTGLLNRLAFETELAERFAQLGRGGLALLFIDLDNFKWVNDNLGHAAGDAVLVEVGRRMSRELRNTDSLFRLGGDEFALLVAPVSDPGAVAHLAGRLVAAVREPLNLQGQSVPVGATVGLAFAPDDAGTASDLLRAADAAMYAAKRAGKNTYRRVADLAPPA